MENQKKKITVLGSANYDIFIFVDRPPEMGETISSSALKYGCGGKGSNQASAIGKLGYPVDFVAQIGDDSSGETLMKEWKKHSVNVSNVKVLENVHTGQAFILSYSNKDNSIIIVGGANVEWKDNNLNGLKESLTDSKYLLLQREIPEEINIKGAKLAKESGAKVVLDYGGGESELSNDLLSLLDIISPNETEFKRMTGKELNSNDDNELIDHLNQLRKKVNNNDLCLLLKLGKHGSLFIDKKNSITRQKAYQFDDIKVVDTTGAGDAFTGAFVTQMLNNEDNISKCLSFASAAGLVCVSRFGATPSLPTKEEVENILKRIK